MKTSKKILSLLLIVGMLIITANTVSADTSPTIRVPSDDNHTYEVYQIFTGTLESDGKLTNLKWGANGNGTAGNAVPQTISDAVAAITGTDVQKATAISGYANLSSDPVATLTNGGSVSVAEGYYLIKDDDSVTLAEGDEHTLYLIKVVSDLTILRKAGTTTSDKIIDQDINDSDTSATTGNETNTTSADYDIGDNVPFTVTAKITEKAEQYSKYHITIEDVLETGKFDSISLDKTAIKLDGSAIAETADYTVSASWDKEPNNTGFKVSYLFTAKEGKTLSSLNGKIISISFTAKLGQGASIGSAGNKNTLKVSYSNNPNNVDSGEGKTPDKQVIVFTYKVIVDKVDQNNQPLGGAAFTLYKIPAATYEPTGDNAKDAASKNAYYATKAIKTWTTTATSHEGSTIANSFSFDGIDDGTYVLCETTTPTGYNTVDPQVFTIAATHGGDDGLSLVDLSGSKVSGTITFTKNITNGSLSTTIQNQSGSTLPTTGGIGTTIFHIAGAALAIGAAVLLISKKIMNNY